jgi:hypothetical protein
MYFFCQKNSPGLHAKNYRFCKIIMILNQLLAKAANGNVEEVGIENEFLSQSHDGKYKENTELQISPNGF